MAQIIPSITSLPVDSLAAPSVEDIQDRLPSICVDYLSHDWSEEDVWASWRNMTRHKHEIANGVRLENASWRTWQKQRNKLKTISPETLNWLKDSDVTWLYGPLHTAQVEPVRPPRESSTVERLGIDGVGVDRAPVSGPVKKPILKHRTLSEMLTIPMPASPILESYAGNGDDDIAEMDEHRPTLVQTKSDTNIVRSRAGLTNRRKSPSRAPISGRATPHSGAETPVNPVPDEVPHTANSSKRHISFNTFVEQCMAIDDPSEMPTIDSDEDEMLEMRSSSSRSSRPSLPRTASTGSTGSEHLTIAMIAPTMLKTQAFSNSEQLPQMVYQPPAEYLSPVASFGGSPSPRGGWAEEDDGGSHDYFGGPNLGADDSHKVQSVPVHQAYRAPTVNQPPSQPKWRQAQSQAQAQSPVKPGVSPQSSSIESSTSSSSASLSQNTSPQSSTPVPARSILKVRAPGPTPPEPSSPPNNYFNYTPSAATGIGGMRGQYPEGVNSGPIGAALGSSGGSSGGLAGSPQISPSVDERGGRGRSTSRDRGSSAFDRSLSRGTTSSNTSATSISPGASRSPVGSQRKSYAAQGQRAIETRDEPKYVEDVDKSGEGMDVDEESPNRGSTPTPHSSPQIPLRRLHDTSPASLPHHSSSTSIHSITNSHSDSTSPIPLPDTPNSLSPPPNINTTNNTGGRATTAQVSTQAKPTIQNNRSGGEAVTQAAKASETGGPRGPGSAFGRLQGHQGPAAGQRRVFSGGDQGLGGAFNNNQDDEDGSSIMGRAANIANTAKDLLGALWYGANPPAGEGGQVAQGGQEGQGVKKNARHKRGASMG